MSNSLFEIDTPLKELSVEELLINITSKLRVKEHPSIISTVQELNENYKKDIGKLKYIYVHLGELYRRNAILVSNDHYTYGMTNQSYNYHSFFLLLFTELFHNTCLLCKKPCGENPYILKINLTSLVPSILEKTPIICYNCKNKNKGTNSAEGEETIWISNYKNICESQVKTNHRVIPFNQTIIDKRNICIYNAINQTLPSLYETCIVRLQEIQMVKETMIKILKKPLLTKELETCMDEILDLNGNKISQMKDYLTEDQYRFVRSGTKFDELEEQQDMLGRMNKMLEDLKRYSIGEAVLDIPVAQPIQHLKNEFASYKSRQKEHEKDLEKLKCKI